MFNVVICAYCLMDNHYHLLISTPDANLSRVMRHINGVYTQKYNRSIKTDGPLFRGRYKAQLVDEDNYQLMVSRYIHLNPVEARIVRSPADYKWSSYQAYLGLVKTPYWLSKDIIISNLANTQTLSHVKNYKDFVELDKNANEINLYASVKNTTPILGSEEFKQEILAQLDRGISDQCYPDYKRSITVPSIETIIKHVCDFYSIKQSLLFSCKRGALNWPHLVCIYICRKKYGHLLRHISCFFEFRRAEAIGAKIRKCHIRLLREPRLTKEIEDICERIGGSLETISV